ncbi:MAG TPA: DegV family protein [Coprothermobacter sp.]|jgi:DegV family protein with EDD domain|nr:DegV family protein [Coprothermobacter sp.]
MFHVIIDSAIDLPEGSTFDDFSLVPLYVKIDTKYYKDVVDISKDEFFRILPDEYDRISTSQPNMEDFLAAINSSKHEDVLVMTISSKISGTYSSALSAAHESDKNVVVFDTWNVSMGAGVLALSALSMRDEGLPLEDVVNRLYELRERTRFWALIATLKNLMRTGRISRFTGLVGEILRVKPVVELKEGYIVPMRNERGNPFNILQKLVREAEGNADRSYPFIVGYTDYVPEIEQLVKEHNALLARVNPIVGAYTGNNTFAIAYMEKEIEQKE